MNHFIDALKLVSFAVHKEGYKFIIIFAIITAFLALFSEILGIVGLVLTLWCVFFFRDPARIIPVQEDVLVSPADGIITRIDYNVEAPEDLGYKDTKFNKISIFLNVFNVHVNRVPVSGKVIKTSYQPGKFLSANAENASSENERNSIVVRTKDKSEIIFTQVAGLVARRIISDIKEDQEVAMGERYGIIRFGSRADIYLPENVVIQSLVGQTMIGGETIIAKFEKTKKSK
ncbi:MAG: phosphatidylserine decarboxylase [Rickettsiales bacterium]|nr:phosphatidylserine decarboxylase [Rickettsiales bacterium]